MHLDTIKIDLIILIQINHNLYTITKMMHEQYINILKKMIHKIITNDLTIGRTDHDMQPYNETQIRTFIDEHTDKINKVIHDMINAYEKDGELEELLKPELDWIGEFLYDEITTITE